MEKEKNPQTHGYAKQTNKEGDRERKRQTGTQIMIYMAATKKKKETDLQV